MKPIYRISRDGEFITDSVGATRALETLDSYGVIGAARCGGRLADMRRRETAEFVAAPGLGDTAIIRVDRLA